MGSSGSSNNTKQKSPNFKPEFEIPGNPLQELDTSITKACKSLCKIIVSPKKLGS